MSFYGNIKRVNSSPFVFDHYYSSRSEMQEKMNNDQVYVGRYVFVSYRTKYENENVVYFDKYTSQYYGVCDMDLEDNMK